MISPPSVLIACCRSDRDAPADQLYPDSDSELLRDHLAAIDVDTRLVGWDDPDVAWETSRLVVIRSTWDSVDRPTEYLAWTDRVSALTRLENPHHAVAWNLDKGYLEELAIAGVATVPTAWVRPGEGQRPLPDGEYVVKPSVSAGGRETARYGPDHADAANTHVRRLLDAGRTVMIQPYLPSVEEPGEISLIFIDGGYSHAVRKGPMFELGAAVRDRPWELMSFLGLTRPSPTELAVAHGAIAATGARVAAMPLYGRVDLVAGSADEPLVLEVELIDPNLSLTLHPPAAAALAAAIAERLG